MWVQDIESQLKFIYGTCSLALLTYQAVPQKIQNSSEILKKNVYFQQSSVIPLQSVSQQ